jgi:hypothetical protein
MTTATIVTKDKKTSDSLQRKGFQLVKHSQKGTYYLAKEDDGTIENSLIGLPAKKVDLQSYVAEEMGWGGQAEYTLADIPAQVEQSVEDELSAMMAGLGVKGGARSKLRKTRSKSKGKTKNKKRANNSRHR